MKKKNFAYMEDIKEKLIKAFTEIGCNCIECYNTTYHYTYTKITITHIFFDNEYPIDIEMTLDTNFNCVNYQRIEGYDEQQHTLKISEPYYMLKNFNNDTMLIYAKNIINRFFNMKGTMNHEGITNYWD